MYPSLKTTKKIFGVCMWDFVQCYQATLTFSTGSLKSVKYILKTVIESVLDYHTDAASTQG